MVSFLLFFYILIKILDQKQQNKKLLETSWMKVQSIFAIEMLTRQGCEKIYETNV